MAALVAYALLSHWLMLHAADRPWAVAVLFGPLVAGLAAAAWQARQWWLLALCAAGVGVLAAVVTRGGALDINRMYVLQHAGIHLALGIAFAVTLRRGSQPMITAIAQTVHATLRQSFSPQMRDYTRWLTALWAGYFIAMVALSALIYELAPWSWWSVFGNLLTPLFVALMFIVEHALRYRLHPEFERVSLHAAYQAYRQSGGSR